jgi:nicotinamide mononucleotide adenylyltransferase
MSGVAGGNRIERGDVQATFNKYVEEVLTKIPGFKKASLSGSVKAGSKADFGDLDIIVWFEGEDKREVKQRLIDAALALPQNIIVPFKSEKYTGRRYYNSGELISVLYPIVGKEDQYIQVDNIISLTEEEHAFKGSFLDLPAEKQGLLIGLAKVILLEQDPQDVFRRMGISNVPNLEKGEEFEFNLSSVKLSLRKVKLENFREIAREEVWSTTAWGTIKILFKGFNIDGSFEDLLDDVAKKLTNARSKNRIAGIFKSMVSVKSGEVGTAKGKGKEDALEKVAQTLAEGLDDGSEIVALYAGGFKPPHLAHFENAKFLSTKADKIIIFIGPKIREGVKITAEQSKAIWEIYAKYINVPMEIIISKVTPILDTYEWIDANQDKVTQIITGAMADEMKKFTGIEKKKEKGDYKNVEVKELPVIVDKEDSKFSATDIRQSEKFLLSGKWIPSIVSKEDKQTIIDIVAPQKQDSIEDKMLSAVDNVFESFFPKKQPVVDFTGIKFDGPILEAAYFQKALHEITLSKDNAVKVKGSTMGGTFTVGDSKYRYSIQQLIKNPYNDEGTFFNISFHPIKNIVSTPQGGKENYVKILSTMYKIIMDFIEKHQPEYVGIGSLDNEEGKNYHTVYASLTDNKANRIPGYFRKDVNMSFNSPEGPGKMVVLKKKKEVQPLEEGSSGTPIQPSGAIPSKDRADLEHLFSQLRSTINSDKYTVVFEQDRIGVYIKTYADVSFDQTPQQKRLPEGVEQEKFDYTSYIGSLLEYMLDQKMNITPLPEVKIRYDEEQANDFFGKTAYYDPSKQEVVLYVMNRHPKDVCRSFSHEMIHHMQNIEGRLEGLVGTTNTNEDDYLQEIEKEAYLKGNITFRNWEDGLKNNNKEVMAEGRYDKISNQASSDLFRGWKEAFDAGEKSVGFEESYSNGDVQFDVEGTLLMTPGTGKMEVLESTGAGFDEDGDFIIVDIAIDPELLPDFWEEISMTLKDLFRHEIEHLTHNRGGVSTNPSKIMRGDLAKRDKIRAGEKPIGDYFKLKKEIDANLQGMYFRAKKEKRPFADVVNSYLDAQNITPQEREEILTLWRKRLPALGLKQTL